MLSPGRYLEQRRRRPIRSTGELALHLTSKLIAAGAPDEFNLDYRIKTQIELAEDDLEALPPAFAKVYAELLGFDVDTYFQLVSWFEQPDWSNPPDICRTCGDPPSSEFQDGLCGSCVRVRANRKRITSLLKSRLTTLEAPTKRIA